MSLTLGLQTTGGPGFSLRWAPDLSVWDNHGHGCFTLSYERFLFLPDVFPGEFVILCTWADGSREGRR